MANGGTAAYKLEQDLPPLVASAVALAEQIGFEFCCRPEQGRLLGVLAAGRSGGVIGETGTGTGVGLAWMVSAASPETRFISVEQDGVRAQAATHLFDGLPNVTVIRGDWRELAAQGPFDLLVLDGGGHGKGGGEPVEPSRWLRPLGALVVDDLAPATVWPPTYESEIDAERMHWLSHPDLQATELRLADDLASLVALRVQ